MKKSRSKRRNSKQEDRPEYNMEVQEQDNSCSASVNIVAQSINEQTPQIAEISQYFPRLSKMSGATVWHLPNEVLVNIFGFLSVEDVGRAANVCSRWASVAEDWRVWCDKSYLLEGPQGLSDALLVARALPVLKKVSICQGNLCKVFLSGESADFVVPDLRDEVLRSAVSSLTTENLSIDFFLLEEASSNCLVVQLHRLKGLRAASNSVPEEVAEAKLKTLAITLSDNPLPELQSVHIGTGINECCGFIQNEGIASGILRALTTCPALRQLSLDIQFSLPCHTVCKLSNVEVVELKGCDMEPLSFLSLCPNLRSLSLTECDINMRLEPSLKFALRSLFLCKLDFYSELLDVLCLACPQLDRIAIDNCSNVGLSLRLSHCLPSNLRHLRLSLTPVSSDSLTNIVKRLCRLETLDVAGCNIKSLRFLCHCAGLSELSADCEWVMLDHYHELGCLKNLQKVTLTVRVGDIGALMEALRAMPRLEALDVTFYYSSIRPNLSFLRHCHQLRILFVNSYSTFINVDLHELTNLKELRKVVVNNLYSTSTMAVEHVLDNMPQLEEMDIGFLGVMFNFSLLDHCRQLTALGVTFDCVHQWHFAHLQCLERLRRLVLNGLPHKHLPRLAKLVRKMPRLEYLALSRQGPNVLESWEWRKALLSLCSDS